MSNRICRLTFVSAVVLVTAFPGFAQSATPVAPRSLSDDDIVHLSPFEVRTSDDEGYQAANSLAGSRLNTSLRDTAASINVMTEEFLLDIGAIDLTQAMQWANNAQLDINDSTGFSGSPNDNTTLENFDNFRVRGVPATITRNYFRLYTPSDAFNIERVEESRGPNSILFGLGSAGGILNTATKQANTNRSFSKAGVTVGSYGMFRGTLDVNQTAFDNSLAVRLNAVHSERGGYRQHTYNDTERVHVAVTYLPFKNTRVRAEYETGDFIQGVARNLALYDSISFWEAAGSQTVTGPLTAVQLTALGMATYGTANRATFIGNSGETFNMRNQYTSNGNQSSGIKDVNVADPSVNTGGPSQHRPGDYSVASIFLEQRLGEKTFIELAYNHQDSEYRGNMLAQGSTEGGALRADPNQFLPNGQPNPNVGQYFVEGFWSLIEYQRRSDNTRLTVSSELDFGKWGNYRFAGLAEYEWRSTLRSNRWEYLDQGRFAADSNSTTNQVRRRNYVVPGEWGTYYVPGPLENGLLDTTDAATGVHYTSHWISRAAGQLQDNTERQASALVSVQARYLDGRIVVGAGLREDRLEDGRYQGARLNGNTNPFELDYSNPLVLDYEGRTSTVGVVGHVTRRISAFYNRSDSFNLPTSGLFIIPGNMPVPNPEGVGQDVGLSFAFLDGKVNFRANYYQVDLQNDTGGFGGTNDRPSIMNNLVLDTLRGAGLITQAEQDARTIEGNTGTQDRHVQGYEGTLTANLTKNWRLQMQYSYTTGQQSRVASEIQAWWAETKPYFESHGAALDTLLSDTRPLRQVISDWEENYNNAIGFQGVGLPGNREHKVNFFTRYSIASGALKGLYFGGGYRHQSKNVIGRNPTTGELYFGNSFWYSDALLGYKIRNVPFVQSLNLQLNVRNVFDKTDPLQTRKDELGEYYRWTVVEPRTWQLSANVEF
jgi:outer membrane receptor protein involved in Fe transport